MFSIVFKVIITLDGVMKTLQIVSSYHIFTLKIYQLPKK